ncbi:transposase [Okeania sp. SIO2C2]|uniref:RNA-guided endonuclease InsQ/TnpB family protein n=1 Tax=Okeania sp. SIO2C2 TaxID=2607787 RepID=UPI00257D6D5D|nr:transposase [Okeania sp. SIO2C2]
MKSMLFPQFKTNPITGWQISLPKRGKIPINLHRPIPEGFVVKQARVFRKADRWFVVLTLQSEVWRPEAQPHGEAIGIDLGLEKFLTTSDREFIGRPRFLTSLYRELELLQRKYGRTKKGSKNQEKVRKQVARFHNHIANVRKDWQLLTS